MIEPERRSQWITYRWPVKVEHWVRIQTLREAAGSLPLYERYVAGDFREVWTELAAKGDAIWLDRLPLTHWPCVTKPCIERRPTSKS